MIKLNTNFVNLYMYNCFIHFNISIHGFNCIYCIEIYSYEYQVISNSIYRLTMCIKSKNSKYIFVFST